MDIFKCSYWRKVSVSVILLRIEFPNIFQEQFWVSKHQGEIAENIRTRHNERNHETHCPHVWICWISETQTCILKAIYFPSLSWADTRDWWCHIHYQQLMELWEDRNEAHRPLNLFNHKACNLLMVEFVYLPSCLLEMKLFSSERIECS